jgi:hypothetical protein
VPPAPADQVRAALRTVWTNLPVLLAGSVPVAAAWVALRALPTAYGWLALAGVGLVVLPTLAALVHGCEQLLADEDFGVADLFGTLVRTYRSAVVVTVVPTAAAVLTLLALHVWRLSHQGWVLASIGAGLAATVATALVAVVALPYRVRTGARPRETWLVSAYVVSRNLVPVLGVASALGLGVWAAAHLSFALVLLLPAPLALVWATALSTATRRSQAQLSTRATTRT